MSNSSSTLIVRYNVVQHPSKILVKHVEVADNGKIAKSRGGQIPLGCTITTKMQPLIEYVHQSFNGGTSQYILPANCELGSETPISAKDFPIPGGVDRTTKTLQYVTGPAVMIFDHDPNRRSPFELKGPDDFNQIMTRLFPTVFSEAAYGGYDSSGSFIYDLNGNEVSGRRGFHTVYAVEDATQIVMFSSILFKRLWLHGYGYIAISKDGKAMPRTIFDPKVIEPQQPLFAGGAHCDGCEQRRPDPVWRDGGYLEILELSPLSEAEEREFLHLIDVAKREAQPECARQKAEYLQKASIELSVSSGISIERAKQIIESRMGGVLLGADILIFDDHGCVTVAEVLANPDKYHEATLADPINGDVRGKAIFYANADSGKPLVFSHAHGGGTFFLKHDLSSLESRLASLSREEALDCWMVELPGAGLRADELERYLIAVKDKTGLGIAALRATAKDAIRNASAAANSSLMEDPGLFLAKLILEERYQGGKTLMALESGYFWHYTGTHWVQVKETVLEGQLQGLATEMWPRILQMWKASEKKPSTMAALLSSTMTCLLNRVVIAGDPLRLNSTRPSVINCANGELWFKDGKVEMRPHRPDSYLTSCSKIEYDEAATAPMYEQAMRGILSLPGGVPMPDQDEMFRHLEELLGYTIQTRRNLKMFVIVVGPGDNGKTTFIKLLTLILGDDAIAFDRLAGVNESGNRFAAGRLVGKLVLVDDDVDFEYLLPDGLLKKIAEEKQLTAEGKFKDHFSFIAQVVPWLLGNSWPRSRDLTRGMQTRANVIYLPRSFLKVSECGENDPDRQNPELWRAIYTQEMSGVLNRLIAGYGRVVERGGFLPPESAKKAFDMWLADANVVARFVAEACYPIDPGQPGFVTSSGYDSFSRWCDANGVQQKHRPQGNQFKKRLEEIGLKVGHTDKGTAVYGLKIKDEWQVGIDPFSEKGGARKNRGVPKKISRR